MGRVVGGPGTPCAANRLGSISRFVAAHGVHGPPFTIVPGGPATPWAADVGLDLTFDGRARSPFDKLRAGARPTDEVR